MVSLKQKQSGFTIVELLIVIVIIGILAGLVITTFTGIQQRARNSERQTDLRALSSQLESYFTTNGSYPAVDDVNTAAWRTGNKFNTGDSGKALADPTNSSTFTLGTTTTTAANIATQPYQYEYVTTPATCTSPTADDGTAQSVGTTPCTSYVLSAKPENSTTPLTINSSN